VKIGSVDPEITLLQCLFKKKKLTEAKTYSPLPAGHACRAGK